MKWTDIEEIANLLVDTHPETNPDRVNFVDFVDMVIELPEFDDEEDACSEALFKEIRTAWVKQIGKAFLL